MDEQLLETVLDWAQSPLTNTTSGIILYRLHDGLCLLDQPGGAPGKTVE